MKAPIALPIKQARRIWLEAQRLTTPEPFGAGPDATRRAVEHLGYVQIDTINVIERAHHHILFTRIPAYRRGDLIQAQSVDKSVFEYWTHALSYVPTRDLRFFLPAMKQHTIAPSQWYADGNVDELRKLIRRIRRDGAISIRDINEEPVEKDHLWASRKPSKKLLQLGFYNGDLTISARAGMVKTYELTARHFGWNRTPTPATARQVEQYLLDRAFTSQGVVSGPSVMHPKLRFTAGMSAMLATRVRKKEIVPVTIGEDAALHWAAAEALENAVPEAPPLTRILNPFDPLIIQRARTELFFGYGHVFEAYVAKAKRQFGYFTLPVLHGDEIVAALDLKTDRAADKVLIQAWHWVGPGNAADHKRVIEEELHRFEAFQLGD